ncbi:MAG: Fe(3+) dicitrate transport protein [Paraglaciecola sp.]|jgi:Fe(3+) dicitrate transport protein
MFLKPSLVSLALSLSLLHCATVHSDDNVEQITIFGSQAGVDSTPGSGAYIDQSKLQDYGISDIMRVLSSAPGVYFMEEDGYGLRPNIGMRGNSSDRSEKVTILEDGMLAAPAPYASPAAYYFPTVGRMNAIEILKGSSSSKYGPRTSGGVLNLVSTPIPDTPLGGKFDISGGSDNYRKLHANVGGQGEQAAGLFEVFHFAADGFKGLNSGQDTGFEKSDLLSKTEFYLDKEKRHSLEFKVKYSTESSDETYVGITEADFQTNTYQRYSASQLDNMDAQHTLISVHYDYIISQDVDLSVITYHNDFHRNWYKVQKIGGHNLGNGAEEAASKFDNAVANGDVLAPLSVRLRANNRNYLSQGVQAQLGYRVGNHNLNFGLRIHADEMDRFQWEDDYQLNSDLRLSLDTAGIPGTNSNRVDSANAISVFIHDELEWGDLTLSGGLRYEDVTLERHDWGTADTARLDEPAYRKNTVSALLPALGATYQLGEQLILLAGVQKAYAPPSPGNKDAIEEDGWNYEAGLRMIDGNWRGEAIVFYSALDNLHGNCTGSQGCIDDNPNDQFNGGKVDITGLELSLSNKIKLAEINIPMSINYTYSKAEFKEDFNSFLEFWGDVSAGDQLPYLPKQTLQFESGLTGKNWQVLAAIKYIDDVRVSAGTQAINFENGVQSHTVVDLSAYYQIDDDQQVYAVVDNLLDEKYVATKRHGGLQVGKPRTVQVGYRYHF